MTRRNGNLLFALAGVLLLAGCATGYHDRLDRYRQASPPPFEQQTMAWLNEAQAATTGSLTRAVVPTLAAQAATTATEDVELALVAQVTGLPAASIAARLDALAQPDAAAQQLGGSFGWRDLSLAVAVANPAVRAARERWQAALQQFSQADYLEALVAQYRTFTRTPDVGAGKPFNKGMLQEFFPYPGTIALKGELIRRQTELARLDWVKTLRDVLVQAGQAFYADQYLWRAEETAVENVALVQDLVAVVEQQYRSGSASQANLLKAQTELERQRNMLEDLRARKRAVAAELNALLDRPADGVVGRPEDADLPLPTLDALTSRALTGRQEVAIQRTRLERASAAIRLGEVMNRPLASQGYSGFERGMRAEASEGPSAMPQGLMAKAKDRPAYAQAEAFLAEMRRKRDSERSMLAQIEAQTRALAGSWLQELDIARREVLLVRDVVLPQHRSAYDISRSAYAAGELSFLDLLDAERSLIAARLERDAARRDLNQTLIRLATVTGQLPTFP